METLSLFALTLFQFIAQSAPYVVIGYIVAALIKEFVPIGVLTRDFGSKGLLPLLRAVLVGAILPICSCGVIPLGIGAFKSGSARGTTLAFMIAAPTISPVAVLLCLSLFGWNYTLLYVGIAIVGSFIAGIVGNRLLSGKAEQEFRASLDKLQDGERLEDIPKSGLSAKLNSALRWAFWDMGGDVSLDLVIGLSLAALLLVLIPYEMISTWLGHQHLTTLVYAMLVGIPMYSCTVPSIPVVQSLLALGMSPGAGLAFMIAGPGTNFGELLAIRRNMGGRAVAFFLLSVFLMALAAGLLADFVIFPGYLFYGDASGVPAVASVSSNPRAFTVSKTTSMTELISQIPFWHWPFIVMLCTTLLFGVMRRFGEWRRSKLEHGNSENIPLPLNSQAHPILKDSGSSA